MEYPPERILELLSVKEWPSGDVLRLFWLQVSSEGRDKLVAELTVDGDSELIVPIVLREPLFLSANALMSDVSKVIAANASAFRRSSDQRCMRVTILLVAKDAFHLPQSSSPIVLPSWFPVSPGKEAHFRISDFSQTVEVALLNCPECRLETISSLVFELERSIVHELRSRIDGERAHVSLTLEALHGGNISDIEACIGEYERHLDTCVDRKVYRPNASKDSKSLVSRAIGLVLRSSPKDIAAHSKRLASTAIFDSSAGRLKPTLLSVMFRPSEKLDDQAANWHAVLLAVYQAYQTLNGAAHAGDYGGYPVGLLYSSSMDLARFLQSAANSTVGYSV